MSAGFVDPIRMAAGWSSGTPAVATAGFVDPYRMLMGWLSGLSNIPVAGHGGNQAGGRPLVIVRRPPVRRPPRRIVYEPVPVAVDNSHALALVALLDDDF